ncbi:MAG TPA: cupin domain-containing protein [Candidatus Dormibacteraeota bacterium]|nr:cupin domain-containing protein [Candidatus Dormibacteraeota bacterium]
MDVRRVVTGRTPEGKSVFVSDSQVSPITLDLLPGAEFHRLWGSDGPVQLPSDGSPLPIPHYFPPLGGFRFGLFTVGPDEVTTPPDLDIATAFAEIQHKLPGVAEVLELDHPGMHTTDTIDYEIVISGEVWLELDDGQEVHLEPGDTVIQNGTRHAWRNKSNKPCVLAVTLIGASGAQT